MTGGGAPPILPYMRLVLALLLSAPGAFASGTKAQAPLPQISAIPALPAVQIPAIAPAIVPAVQAPVTALGSLQAADLSQKQGEAPGAIHAALFDGAATIPSTFEGFAAHGVAAIPTSKLADLPARRAMDAELKPLQDAGFTHHSIKELDRDIYASRGGGWRHEMPVVQAFVQTLLDHMNAELPGEGLTLDRVTYRVTRDRPALAHSPHVDAGYINVAIVLEGPSSLVYIQRPDGTFVEIEPPAESAAILTNAARSFVTGHPTVVHAGAKRRAAMRRVLIVQLDGANERPGEPFEAYWKAQKERAAKARAQFGVSDED